MAQTELTYPKNRLIKDICGLGSMFVMTILLIDLKDMSSWLRYIIAIAAWMAVAAIYAVVFKKFISPNEGTNLKITYTKKNTSYIIAVGFALGCITIFSLLPFGFALNLAISIVINFIVVMIYCYNIAKNAQE